MSLLFTTFLKNTIQKQTRGWTFQCLYFVDFAKTHGVIFHHNAKFSRCTNGVIVIQWYLFGVQSLMKRKGQLCQKHTALNLTTTKIIQCTTIHEYSRHNLSSLPEHAPNSLHIMHEIRRSDWLFTTANITQWKISSYVFAILESSEKCCLLSCGGYLETRVVTW